MLRKFLIVLALFFNLSYESAHTGEKNPTEPAITLPISKVRIFLVAGQSNAHGRASAKQLSAQYKGPLKEVDFCHGKAEALRPLAPGGQFGPEVTFGHELYKAIGQEPGTRIVLVKSAAGGTSLMQHWKANGTAERKGDGGMYIGLQEAVDHCRELIKVQYPGATVTVEGILWVQGESDTPGARPAYYEENLRRFTKDLRATFGDDLRVVISALSNNQTGYGEKPRGIVRAAQEKIAAEDKRNALINTDGFGVGGDQMHFDAAGQEAIGKAGADQMLRLLKPAEEKKGADLAREATIYVAAPIAPENAEKNPDANPALNIWTQGKAMPDPLPLDSNLINQLLALDASCSINLRAENGRSPKRTCIRYWNSAEQSAAWNVSTKESAEFGVTFLINPGRNETKIKIEFGANQSVVTTIPGQGWQRLEIPETLKIPSGKSRITLSLVEPKGTVELKSIELVDVKAKDSIAKRVEAFKGDTSWMKTAGYGIMVQCGGWAYPPTGDKKPWPAFAEEFDAAKFVQQVDDMGGKFLVWSVTWADYLFPAPIESIGEKWPKRISKRDLVGELARECKKRGIRFILYYHMGHGTSEVCTLKGWPDGRTQTFDERQKWFALELKIFREIGERYGELLDGYFVDDGCVWYPCNFEEVGAALKAGNPKRVICFNPADGPNLTPFQDFYAGEAFPGPGPRGQMKDGVMQNGAHAGLQLWGCFKFDGPWGINHPNIPVGKPGKNWSVDTLVNWTSQLEKNRYSIAMNLTMYEDGTISPESYQMLREAAQRMKRGPTRP